MERDYCTISTIVPCFNGAAYVAEAIASIADQDRPPDEIIFVDDGSTDHSAAIALDTAPHLVRVIRQSNQGTSFARRTGVEVARGDFIHFIDADDILPAGALRALAQTLVGDPDVDAAYGEWENFWVEELAEERDAHAQTSFAKRQANIMPGSAMYRASFFRSAPDFRSDEQLHGFSRWLVDRRDEGAKFERVDHLTLRRRIHRGNASRRKTNKQLADFAFEMLARRKRQASLGR